MDLLEVATLPTIAEIKWVTTSLTHDQVEAAIGQHLLAESARFGLSVGVDPIEIPILGEDWWFSSTVVSGWYLLRMGSQRMLVATADVMRWLEVAEGEVPILTFANDAARYSAENTEDECDSYKHTTAKDTLAAAALIDFLVKRLPA